MAQTLAQLTTPKTVAQMRQQLLDALQGRSPVTRAAANNGAGSLALSGTPTMAASMAVKIVSSGEPGAATFAYSLDGGVTWSSTATVPASGAVALGSSGVFVAFQVGAPGAGQSFVVFDTFTFYSSLPVFPVTSWQEGGTARTLVEIDASELADLTSLVAAIARSGFVTLQPGVTGASGPWLDLTAQNVYGLTRNPAVQTIGLITLTDTGAAGPFSIAAGSLWVGSTATLATATPLRFSNLAAGTLPLNGSVTLAFGAEAPGAAYNVAGNSLTTLLTALPGVTVSAGSWITQSGADVESDLALSTRCLARWPSVGIGATAAAVDLWARTASAEVTRTKVAPSGANDGVVNVVVAGSAGAVSSQAITDVSTALAVRVPIGTSASVSNASALGITIAGTVYVATAQVAAATAQVAANLQALLAATPIGGVLYLSQVIEALNAPAGVRNSASVTINGSAADLTLSASQVCGALTNSLTFTGV